MPRHESMQAAHAAYGFDSGTQVEVIGVAENDVRAQLFEGVLRNTFHRGYRADRHENRGPDLAVGRQEAPGAGFAARLVDVEGEGHCLGL